MHVELHPRYEQRADGKKAAELISACVHCGFCLATCPTYLDRRDERDSPRGRIYLIRQLLEDGNASQQSQLHLDRCLSCRSCETTCPSGMQYGQLLDIGRVMIEEQAPRPAPQRWFRAAMAGVLSRPALFGFALRCGQWLRPVMPAGLAQKIPQRQSPGPRPDGDHTRRMLILEGCVQKAATPRTNAAAARVLDRLGISLVSAPRAGCCGAVNYHLGRVGDGLDDMRRNIDAWWPHIEAGVEAIISSATGCGSMIAEYGELLADDPHYGAKAARVTGLLRDLGEVIVGEDLDALDSGSQGARVALHLPCTWQHALGLTDQVAVILEKVGYTLTRTSDKHLCCGSAGTHSILHSTAAGRLRTKKLQALCGDQPALLATANVGCQLHLQEGTELPVKHWIELLDGG